MATSKIQQLELPFPSHRTERLSQASTLLGGAVVSYVVKRSRRSRSITFTIDEQGLRVGAPWRAGRIAIEKLLHENGDWVLEKLSDWQARRPPRRTWREGETLMMLGEPLELECKGDVPGIRMADGRLIVGSMGTPSPDDIKVRIVGWLQQEALRCFQDRAGHYAPALGIGRPDVRLSNGKTRWGSCHIGGRIRLNWRLIQMPMRLVDYVIVHELAHLVEMNHSPRFWKIVAGVLPDYVDRKTDLRIKGFRYLFV